MTTTNNTNHENNFNVHARERNTYWQKGYVKDITEELSEREYEWEPKERLNRKKYTFIRGV